MFKYSDRKSNWSLIGDSLAIPESGVIPAFPFKIVPGIDFTCPVAVTCSLMSLHTRFLKTIGRI